MEFLNQILEIIAANGWDGLFQLEVVAKNPTVVRIRLGDKHQSAPQELVNDYTEGVHPLEQVQQECLRALRTGRIGA